MTSHLSRPSSLLAFAFWLGCVATGLAADAQHTDQFSLRPGERPGSGINARKLDTGNLRWITVRNTDPALTSQGTVSVRNASSSAQATLPVEPGPGGITVRARVRPFTADWIAVAFLGEAERPNWFSETNHLWLYLKPSGQGHLMSRGTKSIGHRRPPPDFDSTGFHILELTYDVARNSVAATVDGMPVRAPVELGLFVPSISAVGFRIHQDPNAMLEAGEPQVDWIEVTTF